MVNNWSEITDSISKGLGGESTIRIVCVMILFFVNPEITRSRSCDE
jgi:hypothetical protein